VAWIRKVALIVVVLVALIGGALAVNQTEIALQFLIWETPNLPAFWWLLGFFVSGGVLGWLLAFVLSLQSRMEQRRTRRELEQCREELHKLRTMALHD